MKTFGQIIAEARKALGISQKDLAGKLRKEDGESISPQYLNDIEHNRRDPPGEFLINCVGGLLEVRDLFNDRRVIARSRFGYLGSSMPPNATPAAQADAFAALLDRLCID